MEELKPLKVLMMGGRRCGKTSVLASMFDQMTNGLANNYLTVCDDTVLETKFNEITQQWEKQDSLNGKILELRQLLGKPHTRTFLVDSGPTNNFWYYKLKIKVPGTNREMLMEFRDSAGEFFEAGGKHSNETKEYVESCDVFIIVIDTPYLMGSAEENDKELCTEAINLGTNRVNDIKGFLSNINDNDGQDAKMVLFVPLKCEKWVKEKRIDEVVSKIKSVYGRIITDLQAYQKMSIGIMPIETAGNILFSEFREAYKITSKIGGTKRCCWLSEDSIVRLADGNPKKVKDTDIVNEDNEAVIVGTNLMRPYSWYRINPEDSSYSPQNCEQLPLHILRFMIGKIRELESQEKKGFWERLKDRIRAVFGKIKINELDTIMERMKTDGVFRESGNGIEYIKRCY